MRKGILITLIIFLCPIFLLGQKYGKVSKEELNMTQIEEDPEANAVVLFRKGEIKITPNFYLEMKIHERFKILTELGKEYTNIEIQYWHENKIKDIKAVSYSPSGKKHKLKGKEIFEEKAPKWNKKVFAIPGVEVGSVVEYQYTYSSEYISNLEPWYFQTNEFTILNEVTVYLPVGFTYSALTKNFAMHNIEEKQEVERDPYDVKKKCTKFIWTATNLSGIKKEPYITAFIDYYPQILFQLTGYEDQYQSHNFAKQWDYIAKQVWGSYKNYVKQDDGLKSLATNLTKDSELSINKAKKLYNYVQVEIKTTDNTGLLGSEFKKPKKTLETKEGSVNEKNLLLLNLFNQCGLDAKPLLISRRSSGKINTDWVNLDQFNRVLVCLELSKKKWFINAGTNFCPFGHLLSEYNVVEGLLVNENLGEIINITPLKSRTGIDIRTAAKLDMEGKLTAHSKITYGGLEAVICREELHDGDIDKYFEEQVKNFHSEAVIDSFKVIDKDSIDKHIKLDLHFHIPEYLTDTGTMAYFSPIFATGIEENPFVREQRNFPVDYSFETTNFEKVTIQIPESFQLSEKPELISGQLKNILLSKNYMEVENKLECQRNFSLKRKQFSSKEYNSLKNLYEKIVNSDQDQIVLIRK